MQVVSEKNKKKGATLFSPFIFNMPIDRHTLKFSGRRVPGASHNLPEVFLDGRLMDIPGNSIMYFFIVFRIRGWARETFRTAEKRALCSRLIGAIVDERSGKKYDPIRKVAVKAYRTSSNSRADDGEALYMCNFV